MKSLFLSILYILACLSPVAAQSLEKKMSARYPATKGKLVIDNQFGKLEINTWDRNEVSVDIIITARARSTAKAQDMLDRISIIGPDDRSNSISYKTLLSKGRIVMTGNSGFSINYVVYMPYGQTAELINKFGDISLSDVKGKLSIDLQYGALKTGTITGPDKDIKVNFGSAVIAYIESGRIKSGYSKLTIDKAGSITVSNQFETTTINTVRELDIDQKYGNLKIGSVGQLSGNAQFAGQLSVAKVLRSAQMNLKYCSGTHFDYIGPDVDKLDIRSSFSTLDFRFDDQASLSGDVSVAFSDLRNSAANVTVSVLQADKYEHSSKYKCKVGDGRGTLFLSASYGKITIR